MNEKLIIGLISAIFSSILTTTINSFIYRKRQKEALIREIADKFIELRKTSDMTMYSLSSLQAAGILLLKKEKDSKKVVDRIEGYGLKLDFYDAMQGLPLLESMKDMRSRGIDFSSDEQVLEYVIEKTVVDETIS